MTEEQRGKRKTAARVEAFAALFIAVSLAVLIWGDLEPYEVDALVSLVWAVVGPAMGLSVGLRGLDATAAQIIPAWKGGKE